MSASPNVLFITADQWRGDCLSVLGHSHVKTPNLDALAADGAVFKHHYAQATPCGPSRACLYTGMYMQNHRSVVNGTPLDARLTNVALQARKVGYKPALFGYTDVSHDPRQHDCGDHVLNSYEGVLPGMVPVAHLKSSWRPWLADLKRKGYPIPDDPWDMFASQQNYPGAENKGRTFAPAKFKAQDSNSAFLVDEAINYLSVRQDKPWFAHLSFLSPHPPFVAPEPFHAMYDARDMPPPVRKKTPELEAQQHPWLEHYIFNQRGYAYTQGADSSDNHLLSEHEMRQIKATYYAMMSEVDDQIGRLIDYLKASGSYDNTLIVFTSDHGEQMGDHWMFAKYGYFDQTFHIPLIIHQPKSSATQARGVQIESFTESVDVMPTILKAITAPIPLQCDGYSLLPLCQGETPKGWRQEYHAEFDLRSPYEIEDKTPLGLKMKECTVNIISSRRYKYVHFTTLPHLFFDHEHDPDEFHNLADDPAYNELMLEYAGKMLSWRMQHDDPGLTDMHLCAGGTVHGLRAN